MSLASAGADQPSWIDAYPKVALTLFHYSSVVLLTVAKRKEPSESCPLELTRCFSDNPRYSPLRSAFQVRGPLHRCL